ncbi:hypothetical protein F4808DRAFT_98127 [Astrocystis sublimbata]|nr:hypothetical protein F4808DRAFT_98127 [Astrocystis sublimbata]
MNARALNTRRSHALSTGAIAGAVIGSLVGGSILLLVLGFLYFRYRRKARLAQAEEALPGSQAPDEHQPGPQRDRNGVYSRYAHTAAATTAPIQATYRSPVSPHGENWMAYNQFNIPQHDTLPPGVDFSFPIAPEQATNTPFHHGSAAPEAANSSYYDTRISMDSDPAQVITPLSTHMTEMYKQQLKEAEANRRSNSLHRRIWGSLTRQSTRNSKGTGSDGAQSPSSQQQLGEGSTGLPTPIQQQTGQEPFGGANWQYGTHNYFEEPGQIDEGVASGITQGGEHPQQTHDVRNGRPTQHSQYGGFPFRIDSTIRQTTEKDPSLPSSVLNNDSTFGLPHPAQPQTSIEQQERLKSPEIPEPMVIDSLQEETNGYSSLSASHSPQLSPDSFTINPMAILHPTNPTEQAAYTTYQIKHSASPPAVSPPAPEITMQQPTQEGTVNHLPRKDDDFADMYLDLPDDDEHRRSIDSYEYPSTPGQSSTAGSNGRTPDTRPTASPSPFPTMLQNDQLKPDPGLSPSSSKPSPQSGMLVCPECGREFDQIHKLNHHKRYHDRAHACTYPDCDRRFGTRTHLDRHINDRHLKLKAYHCTDPSCAWFKGGKSFPRKDNWRRHMVKKHKTTPQEFERMEMAID